MFKFSVLVPYLPLLESAVWVTLKFTFFSTFLGFIGGFFLALITLFAAFPYPFVPIQLTLISALTIGVPSFFLALEPNHDLVKGKFLHNVLRRAFPGGLTAIFVILFAELFVYTFDLTLAELSTICVILMAVNGLMVIYYAARPLDAKRLVLLVAIPLPGTGAWTGALIAAFLNIRLRHALPAITLGLLIAGSLVTLMTLGLIHLL